MSVLSRSSFLNKLLKHHRPIHDLAIVLFSLASVIVLYCDAKNSRADSEAKLIIANAQKETVELAVKAKEEGASMRVVNRLAKALEFLSSSNPSIRLTGIYSLERLANDLPDESVVIARIITTFLTNLPKEIKQDEVHQIFLTLLRIVRKMGAIPFISEEDNFNLNGLKLEGLHIADFSFKGISLSGTYFYNVGFSNIDFTEVNLTGVTFENCYKTGILNFTSANLSDSNIVTSDFSEAILVNSNLSGVTIKGSSFENADFSAAQMEGLTHSNSNFSASIDPPKNNIIRNNKLITIKEKL